MMNDTPLKLKANCIFAPYLIDYVEQKRAMGYKCNSIVESLNLFDDFCIKENISEVTLTIDTIHLWEKRRPHENETTQAIRLRSVRNFLQFLWNYDIQVPIKFHPAPKSSKKFIPYIFTIEEIQKFMNAVDESCINVCPHSPIKHLIYPVLFRMLYGCGLRVNEALKLKTKDVDLERGTFIICETKSDNERMITMSDSLANICRNYRANEAIHTYESEYFLPAPDHGYYDSSQIYATFRKCLYLAGISHGGRGAGPRLHDLRHTFAVHVLNKWATDGLDIYVCLPILQTYLGHSHISSTEKYLRLVPEIYSQMTEQYQNAFDYVFPEVSHEE